MTEQFDIGMLKICGHKNTLLAYIYIYQEGVVPETDIRNMLCVTDRDIRSIGAHLVDKKLVSIRIDSENRIYYVIGDNRYPFTQYCYKECLKYSKTTVKTDDDPITVRVCKHRMCKFNKYFNNQQKIKPVMRITQEYKHITFETHSKVDTEKDILAWTYQELTEHFMKMFTKTFMGMRCPIPKKKVSSYMNELMLVVKRLTGVNEYRAYCKEHVDKTFKTFKTSEEFRMKPFMNVNVIRRTLYKVDKKWEHKTEVPLCGKFDISCTNWIGGKCTLIQDGIDCTKSIREHMVKKYDI